MHTKLQSLFRELESQRSALLQELQEQTQAQLNSSPNGKWSISQIIGHLIQAEQMSVAYMKKKINAIQEIDNTGLWGEIKMLVFIASQRLPLKYKAPKNLGDQPPSYSNLEEIQREWNSSRGQLKLFLESVPDDGLKKKIYRHPVMGRCSVLHAILFFREHMIHHYPQIKRQLN